MLFDDLSKISKFKIGDKVRVVSSKPWAADWPDVYIVVGLFWQYQGFGGVLVDVGLASQEDIAKGYGSTDGFSQDDLELA